MKILKEIKGVFKPPIKKYYIGKIQQGTPYFFPINHVPWVLRLFWKKSTKEIKNWRAYSRVKNKKFTLWGYDFILEYGYPIKIVRNELGWKDKWDSPRFEWSPAFHLFVFQWQFVIWWLAPEVESNIGGRDTHSDTYWEMVLWYLYYCDKDIKKAQDNWGWIDYETKISTWNPNYLI